MAVKTDRLDARIDPDHRELLTWAADQRGLSLSSFVVSAAVAEAERVRVELALTTISAEQAAAFEAWLDAPPADLARLRRARRLAER